MEKLKIEIKGGGGEFNLNNVSFESDNEDELSRLKLILFS